MSYYSRISGGRLNITEITKDTHAYIIRDKKEVKVGLQWRF